MVPPPYATPILFMVYINVGENLDTRTDIYFINFTVITMSRNENFMHIPV